VLERETICSGSTALASGGIRHQYANRIGIELTTRSILTYEGFAEEFGVDPQFRQHGYLILVTTEEELAVSRRSVALQQSLGVEVHILTPDEIERRFPYVQARDLRAATFSPRDGYADPYLAATAIAARARDLGVSIRQHCEVVGFTRSGPRVTGVVTRDGATRAPVVVIAAGCWSGLVGRLAGVDIPSRPAAPEVHHGPVPGRSDPRRHALHHRPPSGILPAGKAKGSCSASAVSTRRARSTRRWTGA
jgi:sarcosine oxidase subunit beta